MPSTCSDLVRLASADFTPTRGSTRAIVGSKNEAAHMTKLGNVQVGTLYPRGSNSSAKMVATSANQWSLSHRINRIPCCSQVIALTCAAATSRTSTTPNDNSGTAGIWRSRRRMTNSPEV
eukprot:Lithocolla_globosa_v1_NODE_5508_length_1229_cov_5.130324.p2 type:complete len:120 gc:universal NODE_5508_length_1229_cov_5.130324:58-417(+)